MTSDIFNFEFKTIENTHNNRILLLFRIRFTLTPIHNIYIPAVCKRLYKKPLFKEKISCMINISLCCGLVSPAKHGLYNG
ncbi:hypothetical protein SIN8267_02165 [Sinobacterium norvegicum]|uniref:Uncharacterized protein n=1 Tax=Sinobacterium norvegicum TaxID=1641715 RepID=A0ABM9AGD5_9GAMM|nr:hypothetical protein SIN8267_02165 [Sinobacterium norvegicum]